MPYTKGCLFFGSFDDTRSENYLVYYGTGHNSILQIPGKDEWYIVYARFNYPNGIKKGHAAGYNREVCIDKMEYNEDGSIKTVKPTHEGILPVSVKK